MSIKISQSLLLGLSLVISSSLFAAVKEYQLVIEEGPVNLTGKTVQRITVNGNFLHLYWSLRKVMKLLFASKQSKE